MLIEAKRLKITLFPAKAQRCARGYPWVHWQDVRNPPERSTLQAGQLVQLVGQAPDPIALGYINPHSNIIVRLLSLDPNEPIDTNFFVRRIQRAFDRRKDYFSSPFYRLINAEGDNLPGLVVDRFSDTFIIQISTLGMLQFKEFIVNAINHLFHPSTIVLRVSEKMSAKEALESTTQVLKGSVAEPFQVQENDFTYFINLLEGQKTGWYFDARHLRSIISQRAQGKRVLDLCCYTGGFGLLCLQAGAHSVKLVDASLQALELAKQTAIDHQLATRAEFFQADVFQALQDLIIAQEKFDLIICDPPPFIRTAKNKASGLKGYEKLAHGCAQLLKENGELLIASCSHHAKRKEFKQAVFRGLQRVNMQATIIGDYGPDRDHPAHPHLPQSNYFKAILLQSRSGV